MDRYNFERQAEFMKWNIFLSDWNKSWDLKSLRNCIFWLYVGSEESFRGKADPVYNGELNTNVILKQFSCSNIIHMPVRFCIFKLNKCQKTESILCSVSTKFFFAARQVLNLSFREKVIQIYIVFIICDGLTIYFEPEKSVSETRISRIF